MHRQNPAILTFTLWKIRQPFHPEENDPVHLADVFVSAVSETFLFYQFQTDPSRS